jgi:hypothetical protein
VAGAGRQPPVDGDGSDSRLTIAPGPKPGIRQFVFIILKRTLNSRTCSVLGPMADVCSQSSRETSDDQNHGIDAPQRVYGVGR